MAKITENVPLAGKTTYQIGGPARFYAEPEREGEIIELYQYAAERGLAVFVLGNGSNLLVSDGGIDGLVINLSAKFVAINWGDGKTVSVLSGFLLDDLAAAAAERGLAGIEELSGIPGTVGGAVIMNAGAFDTEIARTLRSVRVLRVAGLTIENLPAPSLGLGYRTSVLKGSGDVILSAVFEFEPAADAGRPLSVREQILRKRNEKQPLNYPNCGSVFKRPAGNYAGTLIESCSLKNFKIGGAAISEKHANFIINTGNATAEDVRGVIRHAQEAVYEKSGFLLEPEVIFAGDFTKPLYTPEKS
ncbi:MAG: UDP-N-acetylmuramate dehydrogenase [Chitinispirillales bacterium]|nr:UDP-N-acetylmuramate dehydrogenase [Chitinispirillales bacterium]